MIQVEDDKMAEIKKLLNDIDRMTDTSREGYENASTAVHNLAHAVHENIKQIKTLLNCKS